MKTIITICSLAIFVLTSCTPQAQSEVKMEEFISTLKEACESGDFDKIMKLYDLTATPEPMRLIIRGQWEQYLRRDSTYEVTYQSMGDLRKDKDVFQSSLDSMIAPMEIDGKTYVRIPKAIGLVFVNPSKGSGEVRLVAEKDGKIVFPGFVERNDKATSE